MMATETLETLPSVEEKLARLKQILRDMESVVIAFSGGGDSAFVYKVAADVLGPKALGVTGRSPSVPSNDLKEVENFVARFGLNHLYIDTHELEDENYRQNPTRRCFFCKQELFTQLVRLGQEKGIRWIIDGSNADDSADHRPGMQAGRQLGVRSPLQEAGLTKEDIRALSRQLGLPTWNKPASACLASRFPYGVSIRSEKLRKVDRCEEFLRSIGIEQLRIRHHEHIARIEVLPKDFEVVLRHHSQIVAFLKKEGYAYVTLDLQGFRSGSMNEAIQPSAAKDSPGEQEASRKRKSRPKPPFVPKTFGADIHTLYIDGACPNNPGTGGWGYVLFNGQGREVHRDAQIMHDTTSNLAEYQALISGLDYAQKNRVEKIHVLTDSELLTKQMLGEYRIKNRGLQQMAMKVHALRTRFRDFEISHVSRLENTLAHEVAHGCLKKQQKKQRQDEPGTRLP